MRQCLQCGSYSPDYSQNCRNCGSSLTVGQTANRAATTQAPGQPPTVVRRRKYRVFIPGLGVFGFLQRDPQTGQWGCGPGCLISSVLAAVVALGGFLLVQHSASVANLSFSGNIVHGGSIQVHGSNFPPRSTVGIYVDGAPSASRSINVAASIGDLFMPERQTHPSDHIVTVGSDGTFDTTIPVPSSWVPGSHHTIQAITQNVQASTQASIDVETQSSGQPSAVPSSAVPTAPPTTSPIPMPIVSGITPTTGPASGGTSITLSGAHLSNTTSVSFGSTTANNFHIDSDTQITAVSPAGSGTVDVTVTTSGGTSATSSNDLFTYTPPPVTVKIIPVVSSISPNTGLADGGTTVTITGSGFTGATSVSFGSTPADSFTVDNDTQITAVSPAGSGTVDITVTTSGGTSATSRADQFAYYVVS